MRGLHNQYQAKESTVNFIEKIKALFNSRLVVSDEEAIEGGFKYKATLYGTQVYINSTLSDEVWVANKFALLTFWVDFVQFCVGISLYFLPSDTEYEMPFKNIKPLIQGGAK
jgi:hypothetical protein